MGAPTLLDSLVFADRRSAVRILNRFARALASAGSSADEVQRLEATSRRSLDPSLPDYQALRAAMSTLADLAKQGWEVSVNSSVIQLRRPAVHTAPDQERARVRSQLHHLRDEQLRKRSVRAFVQSMERRRLHQGRLVSVFSLMRDGRDLAEKLNVGGQAIAPYLQVVDAEKRDEHTGQRLQDVWRYFRHTWSSPYRSLPGRGVQILVRDGAARCDPVIGIAALGSSAVQIRCRDEWIGWTEENLLSRLLRCPPIETASWLVRTLGEAIGRIYSGDLIEDQVIEAVDLRGPSQSALQALDREASEERARHRAHTNAADFKRARARGEDHRWLGRAKTHLFRSKRAAALAELLRAWDVLSRTINEEAPTATQIQGLLSTREGRRALQVVVRLQKKERVGVNMADIVVCGAVAPYNLLLGGKLISLLMASPEIRLAYYERFKSAESLIASSMAGRRVVKEPHLVLLGTTSLYSVGSSQYNRVRLPCELVGGASGEVVRYRRLGKTSGFGSQFSPSTVQELSTMLSQRSSGQRANNIFGEGQSPKFRTIREALDNLGFPSEQVLNHGSARLVYGVALARNFREYLVGLEPTPDYYIPGGDPKAATAQIVQYWRERWLRKRIGRAEVLSELRAHTLVRPIRHGARVPVAPDVLQEVGVFDDL